MRVVTKLYVSRFKHAFSLDVNALVCIDQDIGNRWISQERFEGTESKDFVQNFLNKALTLLQVHWRGFAVNDALEDQAYFTTNFLTANVSQFVEVQLLNQLSVNSSFNGSKIRARRGCYNRRHTLPHFFVGNENKLDSGLLFSSAETSIPTSCPAICR